MQQEPLRPASQPRTTYHSPIVGLRGDICLLTTDRAFYILLLPRRKRSAYAHRLCPHPFLRRRCRAAS